MVNKDIQYRLNAVYGDILRELDEFCDLHLCSAVNNVIQRRTLDDFMEGGFWPGSMENAGLENNG